MCYGGSFISPCISIDFESTHTKNTKAINIIHKQNTIQSCGFFLTRCSVPLHFNSPAEFSIPEELLFRLTKFRDIRDACCFKPLILGVVCYTANVK